MSESTATESPPAKLAHYDVIRLITKVEPGTGPDDKVIGHHPDVIISNDRAYIFYFTHPGQAKGGVDGSDHRRSSIQVGELKYDDAGPTLTVDRNAPTLINLQPPADPETESKSN